MRLKSLNGFTSGRYLVHTQSGSRYDIDLDRETFTRLPAMDMAVDRSLRRDGEEATLLEIVDCTVGRSATLMIDLSWGAVLFTRRCTTSVVSIERLDMQDQEDEPC